MVTKKMYKNRKIKQAFDKLNINPIPIQEKHNVLQTPIFVLVRIKRIIPKNSTEMVEFAKAYTIFHSPVGYCAKHERNIQSTNVCFQHLKLRHISHHRSFKQPATSNEVKSQFHIPLDNVKHQKNNKEQLCIAIFQQQALLPCTQHQNNLQPSIRLSDSVHPQLPT